MQRWFVEETRLGIPVDFTNEGIHGLNHTKATPLPAPIAIGSTWNKELVRRAGVIAGQEAKRWDIPMCMLPYWISYATRVGDVHWSVMEKNPI